MAVGRRLPGLDSGRVFDGRQQLGASLHVAGRTQADRTVVLPLGREGEEMIERRDAVDAARRQLEPWAT